MMPDAAMRLSRETLIERPIEVVFDFVSEPSNDPTWCPKVQSVEQSEGDGPGPGSRYRVVHRPIPLRPARQMEMTCVAWDPPHRIQLREDDGKDVIEVTYELEAVDGATRLTQSDDAELGAPRLLEPVMRLGIGHDIDRQLRDLKRLLERA